MFSIRRCGLIVGLTATGISLLLADDSITSLQKGPPEAARATAANGGKAENRAAEKPAIQTDAPGAERQAGETKLMRHLADVESRLAAQQAACDRLERQLNRQTEELHDLRTRLEASEGHQNKTQAQVVRFQRTQQERQLNPTEHKQISELIQQRVLAAQVRWLQATGAQPCRQPRHEEPLYAP